MTIRTRSLFLLMTLALVLLAGNALATTKFSLTPVKSYGPESAIVTDSDGNKIWDRIDLLADEESGLFAQELFLDPTEWHADDYFAPHIKDAFGSATPNSKYFLLHYGLGWQKNLASTKNPVLFVPGAGDNASRGWAVMSYMMAEAGWPVFALTFAHNHGDNYMQAEHVANAIRKIRELTGRAQVDLVTHSKGGIVGLIYTSNSGRFDWGRYNDAPGAAYSRLGTAFRRDVGKLVMLGVPLQGVDTGFRWSLANFTAVNDMNFNAPVSWQKYYPLTTVVPFVFKDLRQWDVWDTRGNYFPGQSQVLGRFDRQYSLPGATPALMAYAAQPDWYTTYHGGHGFNSYSGGIASAIREGGNLIEKINSAGVDPSVALYLMVGTYPVLAVTLDYYLESTFGKAMAALVSHTTDFYANFFTTYLNAIFPDVYNEDVLFGLTSGNMIFGEISGPSDGEIFIDSATTTRGITSRGARIRETNMVELTHTELPVANAVFGQYLIDTGNKDPRHERHLRSIGERFVEYDSVAWVEGILK